MRVTYENNRFPLLDHATTIEAVRTAVSRREPFSLIRIGDGEAVALSIDDGSWLYDLEYLHSHWGAERVALADALSVKSDLAAAARGADIVGVRDDIVDVNLPPGLLDLPLVDIAAFVRSNFHLRSNEAARLGNAGARRLALVHRVMSGFDWSPEQRFCSAWIHWELLASMALNEILEEVPRVGLVTSRPELTAIISQRYDVQVTTITVPDKFVNVPVPGAHVPDRYREIRSEFRFPEGTPVLVGAGIPGKVYCQWLKELGCVAIDVGAVLDAWVGMPSRRIVLESRFNVPGGDHVPEELQLTISRPPETDTAR